jgi:hypothetical protein
MVEEEKGMNIKCLRSNGGGKYFSNQFNEYLNMEFKGSTHVVIPHSKMELLKGKTCTL